MTTYRVGPVRGTCQCRVRADEPWDTVLGRLRSHWAVGLGDGDLAARLAEIAASEGRTAAGDRGEQGAGR